MLGLRVKSGLSDPMSVLLTVAQNRFLLNSLRGEGFLNMRLTDEEAKEVVGIDPVRQVFEECIASRPCVMNRSEDGDFLCDTHSTLFLPALLKGSALWKRAKEGLALFAVPESDLSAVTAFRLDMVQRPRFTARLHPRRPRHRARTDSCSGTPPTPSTSGRAAASTAAGDRPFRSPAHSAAPGGGGRCAMPTSYATRRPCRCSSTGTRAAPGTR